MKCSLLYRVERSKRGHIQERRVEMDTGPSIQSIYGNQDCLMLTTNEGPIVDSNTALRIKLGFFVSEGCAA